MVVARHRQHNQTLSFYAREGRVILETLSSLNKYFKKILSTQTLDCFLCIDARVQMKWVQNSTLSVVHNVQNLSLESLIPKIHNQTGVAQLVIQGKKFKDCCFSCVK